MAWRSGQAYAQDLRDRVLVAAGSARVLAARFGVSVSYVVQARQRQRDHGEVSARPQHSHTPRLLAGLHHAILAHVEAHTDATVAELREWLQREHRVSASMGLMWNTLRRLGPTLKKKTLRAAEQARADVAEARRLWVEPNPVSTQRG